MVTITDTIAQQSGGEWVNKSKQKENILIFFLINYPIFEGGRSQTASNIMHIDFASSKYQQCP